MAAEPKVEARPKKWLTPVILVLLQEENSYGYELMDRLEEEFGFEQINPSSVYRTLRLLEKEGLCESEWKISTQGGPSRRMYRITEAGETYLDAWADACEQYQQVVDSFSRVYRNRTMSRSSE